MAGVFQRFKYAVARNALGRTTAVGAYTTAAAHSVERFLAEVESHPQDRLVPRLAGAKQHLLRAPGKMVRPLVVWLLGSALGVRRERIEPYALVVELIHAASLLHDDVIDRAEQRRHAPSANARYDNTLPVLAGDGMLAEVMVRISALDDMPTVQAIAATIQDLVAGEAWQYELRGQAHDDAQACVEVAELKTGSLLSLCTWLPAYLAGRNAEDCEGFAAIGRYTGISFQIIDDLLDFGSAETGKPMLGDWSEGKTNAMTAVLLGLHPQARAALQGFFSHTERRTTEACAELLAKWFPAAVIEEATRRLRALAEEYAALADHHARRVPDNADGRLFEELRRSLLSRRA